MKIPRILIPLVWVVIIAAFSTLVGLIANWLGAYLPIAWGFFTLIGIFAGSILFVIFRQAYWWFTGKEDYLNGGFPKLWKKIKK
jgi:hypothetical protein